MRVYMRVVAGQRYTRASELLYAGSNFRQTAIVLELRAIGHTASRIFGLHRSERNSIEANLRFAPRPHSPATMPAAISLIFAAMMKSFSCKPLIFLVCNTMTQKPQPKVIDTGW